jgi:hypothetical protein
MQDARQVTLLSQEFVMREHANVVGMSHDAASDDGMPIPEGRREAVAGTLDGAAERLHSRMTPGKVAAVTDQAAGALDATAAFVRDFDSRRMLDDVGAMARKHPGRTLAVAVILGFLLGRSMTRPST